ncbi:hypothetical protein NL460_28385, partial [Klebsiella pneumoniae]|nr:hypothetical protein [Klebsiella pneumoniae]
GWLFSFERRRIKTLRDLQTAATQKGRLIHAPPFSPWFSNSAEACPSIPVPFRIAACLRHIRPGGRTSHNNQSQVNKNNTTHVSRFKTR